MNSPEPPDVLLLENKLGVATAGVLFSLLAAGVDVPLPSFFWPKLKPPPLPNDGVAVLALPKIEGAGAAEVAGVPVGLLNRPPPAVLPPKIEGVDAPEVFVFPPPKIPPPCVPPVVFAPKGLGAGVLPLLPFPNIEPPGFDVVVAP